MAVKTVEPTGDGLVKISGYASTPDIDRYRDIVDPTAFKDALDMYFKNPVMLRSHDADRPVGTVTAASIDSKGLKIEAVIHDEQTQTEIKDGRMRAMSIGYIPLESSFEHEDGSPFNAEKDSPWDNDLIRKITKLDLVEISIVAVPANGNALFTIQKSVQKHFAMLATKAFGMGKKEADELPDNEVDLSKLPVPEKTEGDEADEAKVEKPAETVEEAKPEAGAEGAEKTEEQKETTEKTEQTAAEADTTTKPKEADQPNGAENAVENPAAPASEGVKTEGDKGDAPEDGGSEGKQLKTFVLDSKTAAQLPELVQAGLATVDEKAAEIPVGFVEFTKQLLQVSTKQVRQIAELEEKVAELSIKKPLAPAAQFAATTGAEAGAAAKASEEEKGLSFVGMIANEAKKLSF